MTYKTEFATTQKTCESIGMNSKGKLAFHRKKSKRQRNRYLPAHRLSGPQEISLSQQADKLPLSILVKQNLSCLHGEDGASLDW
jgi:hypothetical protein